MRRVAVLVLALLAVSCSRTVNNYYGNGSPTPSASGSASAPAVAGGVTLTIKGENMAPTLGPGDVVIADPNMQVNVGDMIAFRGPPSWQENPGTGHAEFVSRVLATGGDHIVCCDSTGALVRNGARVPELYLAAATHPSEQNFDVTVPDGHLWVMGDNRSASADSRSHLSDGQDGTVPLSDVVGVIVRVNGVDITPN